MAISNSKILGIPRGWVAVSCGALFYCYQFALRVSPNVMHNELMHDFAINATAFGTMIAFYSWSYAGVQIPLGIALDRLGPGILLTWASLICALSCFIFSISTSAYVASFALFLMGLGSAGGFLGSIKLGTVWFPPSHLARVIALIMLQDHPLWVQGEIEIQDEGSQIVSLLVEAKPGLQIFDYCAGAGGKTLAMAAMMANKGRIVATDAVAWRLERSRERFKRSGVFNVECRTLEETNRKWLKRQEGRYDRVLVDVPCSGSGTWRRNPDLKIRLTEQDFDEILQKQYHIMEQASWLVKPGGRLIYATCSILRRENHDQIAQFLAKHPEFKLLPIAPLWTEVIGKACPTSDLMLQLTPAQHQVDGFFAAVMERVV